MTGDARLAVLIMYAETLATANKLALQLGTISTISMPCDPQEVLDILKEVQGNRTPKMMAPTPPVDDGD